MDILDIDEALKDDSFIFQADKAHDDVSNILQQWKTNNCLPARTQNLHLQQQQHHDQAYKLNTKTFTRPKRKSAQNLESQFSNLTYSNHIQQQNGIGGGPMLNLEIGGLVTTMHKSFLQDTSPPSSICSSMDVSSIDRMNNSLITSADFSNLNFLQSTQTLDFNNEFIERGFNLSDKTVTADGYTLSDVIRDRKALESLTLSGDGTLIKDTHIGQIDDISLTLSKTASGCSTMDNSTESMEIVNKDRTFDSGSDALLSSHTNVVSGANFALHCVNGLSDGMIIDTSLKLVENSIYNDGALDKTHNVVSELNAENESFKKAFDETICIAAAKVNTTYDCQQLTPDARSETPENTEKKFAALKYCESTPLTTNVRYKNNNNNKQQFTPTIKNIDGVNISPIVATNGHGPKSTRIIFNETFESEQNKQQQSDQQKQLECVADLTQKISSNTFTGPLPQFEKVEMIENIENPNETFNKSYQRQVEQQTARKQMQNVMDLAEVEVELLAQEDNEDKFEHMLDEIGKVEPNVEQLKMQKSLETIKKRFNYSSRNCERSERELSREAQDMRELSQHMSELMGELSDSEEQANLNVTTDIKNSTFGLKSSHHKELPTTSSDLKTSMLNSKDFMKDLRDNSSSGLTSSTLSSHSSGERLLNRRSRLYDDVNLSMLSSSNNNTNSTSSNAQTKSSNSTSFTVHQNVDENISFEQPQQQTVTEQQRETEVLTETDVLTETEAVAPEATTTHANNEAAANYKLAEKRERDRDRFKTIKITKPRAPNTSESSCNGTELNVPCIDDDFADYNSAVDDVVSNAEQQTNQFEYDTETKNKEQTNEAIKQRYSRRDHASPPVFNNNKSEIEQQPQEKVKAKSSTNYLTYKKPKDNRLVKRQLPEIIPASTATENIVPSAVAVAATTRLEPRSLSRPRYISGIQKFSVVSKATSAGDLQKTTITNSNKQLHAAGGSKTNMTTTNFNRTQPNVGLDTNTTSGGELKSPMGIKSKSFHNLSSNFGYQQTGILYGGCGGGGVGSTGGGSRLGNFGLSQKIYNAANDKQTKTNALREPQTTERSDDAVFKVPKLVSGIRATHNNAGSGVAGLKRAGLTRPSSGYYSLNVAAAKNLTNEQDIEQSDKNSTESLSSASSRGSATAVAAADATTNILNSTMTLTKVTTGATGIPKPSGLRPPTNMKRSALPRPSSIVRR